MKEYEKWTAEIEEKIEKAARKKEERRKLRTRVTAGAVCAALIAGCVLILPHYMNGDRNPLIAPSGINSETKGGVDTMEKVSPETEPSEIEPPYIYRGPRIVTYKTETAEYSWAVGQSSMGTELPTELCPEGHYDGVGHPSYHSVPTSLVTVVEDVSPWDDFNAYDLQMKLEYQESLGRRIAGKCEKDTVRHYIDEHGITREDFDKNVDLVVNYAFNLDVLYGDYDYCDEYYRYTKIFERRQKMYNSYNETLIAIRLNCENKPEGLANDSTEKRRRFGYSIPELAYHYGLSEDELRAVIKEIVGKADFELTFNYDFSVIYNEDGTFREELSELDVTENDFDAVVDYAAELGEAFCRIYEWEDPAEIGDVKNEGDGLSYSDKRSYACTGECIERIAYRCEDILEERGDKSHYPTGVLNESPFPLKTLIDEYGLTREDVKSVVSEMAGEYDIPYDVLFEGTMDEVLEYYKAVSHRVKHYRETTFDTMLSLIRTYYNDADGTSLKMYGSCSIPELAVAGQISREELLAIIAEVKRREEPSQVYYGGAFYQYGYDLDVIYNEDGSFKDLSGCDSGTLQAMFTGDERYY